MFARIVSAVPHRARFIGRIGRIAGSWTGNETYYRITFDYEDQRRPRSNWFHSDDVQVVATDPADSHGRRRQ